MPNKSGDIYGLTILCPIKRDPNARVSPSLAIRGHLHSLHRHGKSPFAKITGTHMARLVVMDDVVYEGTPSHEEHLRSKYLVFESNFDGDLDAYLTRMITEAKEEVADIWKHCQHFPGVDDPGRFVAYMKKCQIETTFYFADVNNKTVGQTLKALQTQSAVARFIEKNQGNSGINLQQAFAKFLEELRAAPAPAPGTGRGREFTGQLL